MNPEPQQPYIEQIVEAGVMDPQFIIITAYPDGSIGLITSIAFLVNAAAALAKTRKP